MNEIKIERKKLTLVFIGAALVALVIAGIALYEYKYQKTEEQSAAVTQPEPVKTDFGTTVAPDFPTNIPIEKGAKVSQSYSLDYAGQKQLTIVFPSTKTIAANYTLYTSFLKTDGWTVSNKYESAKLSSLYATKAANDINITLSEKQVSISVLKK